MSDIIENRSRIYNKFIMVEKYRPKHVRHILLPNKFRNFFNSIIEKDELPNLLLHSSVPGNGKTSIARALCHDLGLKHIEFNCSMDSGIDILRDDIEKFAAHKALNGKLKAVILDEFDEASQKFQAGLRNFVNTYSKTCRFIITCNYLHKILAPLHEGRFNLFDFNMMSKEHRIEMYPLIKQRLELILNKENIVYDIKTVEKLIKTYYPDIRQMVSLIQKYSGMNGNIDDNIFNLEVIDDELYEMVLTRKVMKARKFILEKNYNFDQLYTKFFNNFVPRLSRQNQGNAIITISEYMNRHTTAIDPDINFTALLVELANLT